MAGLPRLSTPAFRRISATKRTVARPYGGVLDHSEVKDRYFLTNSHSFYRIVRAFLIEEVKLMKRMLQQKEKSSKKSKKAKAKGKKK